MTYRTLPGGAALIMFMFLLMAPAQAQDGQTVSVENELALLDDEAERMLTDQDWVDGGPPEPAPAFDPIPVDEQSAIVDRYDLPLGLIGEVEPVFIEDVPYPFAARIDTGASLCSLDAEEIKYFERDGKPWVAFTVYHRETEECFPFERRIKRMVNIKVASDKTDKRPLVEMTVRIGDMALQRDFTLNDRGNFQYQVLVGRNLLNGIAAVDVSRSYSLEQLEADG